MKTDDIYKLIQIYIDVGIIRFEKMEVEKFNKLRK